MKDDLIERARLHAEHVLMPRLTQFKDWQADKRDALKVRIARIRSGKGDNFSEVQSALDALEAAQAENERLRDHCLAEIGRLREAWSKRAGTTEVTGDGLPYLKVYFENIDDVRLFGDVLRKALEQDQ